MEGGPASGSPDIAIHTLLSPESDQVSDPQSIYPEPQLSVTISTTSLPDSIVSTDPINAYELAKRIQDNPNVLASFSTTTVITLAMTFTSTLDAYEAALMAQVSRLRCLRDEVRPLKAEIMLLGRLRDVSEQLELINEMTRRLQTDWASAEEYRSLEQHSGLLRDVIRTLVEEMAERSRERVVEGETEEIVDAITKWKKEVLARKEERRRQELLDETERLHVEHVRPGGMPGVLHLPLMAELLRRVLVRTWWCRMHFVP